MSLLLEADPGVEKASVLSTEVKTVGSFPGHFESKRLDGVSSWYKALSKRSQRARKTSGKVKRQRRETSPEVKPFRVTTSREDDY